jgi:hypothetical protein
MPIKPTPTESEKEFISRCMSEESSSFPDEQQRYAVCIGYWQGHENRKQSLTETIKQDSILNQESYTDYPKAASDNAKRALKYRDESGNPKGCGTQVGWTRANQLANREPISRDTIARMASFDRHRQNKDVPYEEGCGGLMWDAWGGTEGVEWAQRKLKEIDNENK